MIAFDNDVKKKHQLIKGVSEKSERFVGLKIAQKYHLDSWYTCMCEEIYKNLPEHEWKDFMYDCLQEIYPGFDFNTIKTPFYKLILEDMLKYVPGNELFENYLNRAILLLEKPLIELKDDDFKQMHALGSEIFNELTKKYSQITISLLKVIYMTIHVVEEEYKRYSTGLIVRHVNSRDLLYHGSQVTALAYRKIKGAKESIMLNDYHLEGEEKFYSFVSVILLNLLEEG